LLALGVTPFQLAEPLGLTFGFAVLFLDFAIQIHGTVSLIGSSATKFPLSLSLALQLKVWPRV